MKKDLLESNYSKLISDFNLSKVTVIEWDDYFSYTLASETVEGEYYTIILSKDVNDVNNNLNIKRFSGESFLLNIDATQDGTGTLKETSKYGINTAVFDKGKLCTVSFQEYTNSFTLRSGSVTFEVSDVEDLGDPLKGKLFRECFDKAYDTICDGFIGCLAWYTNPTVPITAAVWCTLK
ncbi:MAG: hypothetical protein LBI82_01240 [Dysgonamonadaceae bacterium]|nr:hypothetical protein [Dysgonamonadaceae bacterium]